MGFLSVFLKVEFAKSESVFMKKQEIPFRRSSGSAHAGNVLLKNFDIYTEKKLNFGKNGVHTPYFCTPIEGAAKVSNSFNLKLCVENFILFHKFKLLNKKCPAQAKTLRTINFITIAQIFQIFDLSN